MSDDVWTVRRLLEWTTGFFQRKQVDSPRLSAELLLSHVLNAPRIQLYTGYERTVRPESLAQYRELVRRAGEHEPVAYLTAKAHFFNLELDIAPGVLIPRPDTETLVENVVQHARRAVGLDSPRILDLCTGSGCIALALADQLRNAQVIAVDSDPAAVALAIRNTQKLNMADHVSVRQGDLYEALLSPPDIAPFDLIVANPPYIPTADIAQLDRTVRDYEPVAALDGGTDGMDLHRRILAGAPRRLKTGGRIYLEIQFDQGQAVAELMRNTPGLTDPVVLKDHAAHERVVTAAKGE